MTRNYGNRADEPCGSWVPVTPGPDATNRPRYVCRRPYHPDDELHYTADKTRWWITGERQAWDIGTVAPDNPAYQRMLGITRATVRIDETIANTPKRANTDTTDIRAGLDAALAAALPRAGGKVHDRIIALQRALADVDRQRARTEPS